MSSTSSPICSLLLLCPKVWSRASCWEMWRGILTSTSRTLTPPVMIAVLMSLRNGESEDVVFRNSCSLWLLLPISKFGVVEARLIEPLVQPYGTSFLGGAWRTGGVLRACFGHFSGNVERKILAKPLLLSARSHRLLSAITDAILNKYIQI